MSSRDAFLDFQRLSRKSKNWRFRWPRTCEKIAIFANFSVLHILPPNEWIFTFQLSWCQVGMLSLIFKGFPENQKNWRFRWPRTCEKIAIFANFSVLHILPPNEWIFTFQLSWCQSRDAFLDFQRLSRKSKNWRFRWPRTCEKLQFLLISVFCIFCPQMSEFYISVVLMSSRDAFLDFQRLSRKSKKLKISMTADLRKNCNFC